MPPQSVCRSPRWMGFSIACSSFCPFCQFFTITRQEETVRTAEFRLDLCQIGVGSALVELALLLEPSAWATARLRTERAAPYDREPEAHAAGAADRLRAVNRLDGNRLQHQARRRPRV